MSGGATASGSPLQSKKFRLRSQSCPARILGSNPDDFFATPRTDSRQETDSHYSSDKDIAIGDFFATPPKDSPRESGQDKSYPSVFEPSSEEHDTTPGQVHELLEEVTYRLSELIIIGFLREAEDYAETRQNVD